MNLQVVFDSAVRKLARSCSLKLSAALKILSVGLVMVLRFELPQPEALDTSYFFLSVKHSASSHR